MIRSPKENSVSPQVENYNENLRYEKWNTVGIKAYKISFFEDNIIYNFDPINAYHVSEETKDSLVNVFVIDYKLKIRTPRTIQQAIIPYYISDGETNHLKANLLFPFICFNENTTEWTSACVNNESKRGFLYKLDSFINVKHVNERDKPIFPNESSTGLTSVLNRIQNFLDFIITTLTSDKIDKNNLTPHNLLTFRPFILPTSKQYYYTDVFPVIPNNQQQIDDDKTREMLINYFLQFKNENNEKKYFEVVPCFVILNKKSVVDFNIKHSVCNSDRTRNLKAANNYKNYSYISENLVLSFIKRISRPGQESPLFSRLILPLKMLKRTETLGDNTDGWEAFCSQGEKDIGKRGKAGHFADVKVREDYKREQKMQGSPPLPTGSPPPGSSGGSSVSNKRKGEDFNDEEYADHFTTDKRPQKMQRQRSLPQDEVSSSVSNKRKGEDFDDGEYKAGSENNFITETKRAKMVDNLSSMLRRVNATLSRANKSVEQSSPLEKEEAMRKYRIVEETRNYIISIKENPNLSQNLIESAEQALERALVASPLKK